MSIQDKLLKLREEINTYRKDRDDPVNKDNKSFLDWTNGLISGLRRAECILEELEEENARSNPSSKQENA